MPPADPPLPRYHRHFLGWDRPALASVAQRLLDRGATDGVADLSGVAVALPGGRAGRRLREILVGAAADQGVSVTPPRILTVGAIPELFYRPSAPPPPSLVVRRAWAAALGSLAPGELRTLMARPPGDGDHPAWFALAGTLETLHRELGAQRLTFRQVAEVCGSGLLFDDAPRWELLARIQEGALERLAGAGWEDREAARARALEGAWDAERAPWPPKELWLVALPELPGVVREFLAFAPCDLHILVNAPEAESDGFAPDGTVKIDHWVDREVPLDRVPLHVVGGPADQADAVAEALRGMAGDAAPGDAVVGLVDPGLLPFLRQRLDLAGLASRSAEGARFEDTPVIRLLMAAAEHLEAGRARSFATLVRHPDLEPWLVQGGVAPGPALAALDRYREDHLPPRLAEGAIEVGAGGGGKDAVQVESLRSRMEALLAPLRPTREIGEWAAPVEAMLQGIYGHRELREEKPGDRTLLAVIPRIRELLEAAGAAAGDDGVRLSGGAFLRALVDLLRGGAVPPLPEDNAVEILGWLELPLDDAPLLILSGMNEPHLPEAVVEHPFLPDALRERLGIPDNRHRRGRDGYLLHAVISSRRQAVLVAGRRGPEGDPLRLSRLLLTGNPEAVANRIRGFLGDLEPALPPGSTRADPAPRRLDGLPDPEPAAPPQPVPGTGPAPVLSLPPEPEIVLPSGPIRVPISSFALLLRSPYEWALTHILRLRVPDDGAVELSALGFGNLLHAGLESLGHELREEVEASRLEEGLMRALTRVAASRYGPRPLPSVRVQIALARDRLRRAAQVEAKERAEGWHTVAVEVGLPREGVSFPVAGRKFLLSGRVDRVDMHPDGRWRLLDYKTGQNVKDPEKAHRSGSRGPGEPEWTDLQLPLYHHLAGALEDREGHPLAIESDTGLEVGYFALPAEIDAVGIRMARWGPDDFASALVAARRALEPLASKAVIHDPAHRPPHRGSPLAPLLGFGILTPASPDDEEEDEE